MRNYKSYGKTYIGVSDVASLVVRTSSVKDNVFEIYFGGDGGYKAYIVDEECDELPEHYELTKKLNNLTWFKVYDDDSMTYSANWERGMNVEIWQSGDYGIVIRIEKSKKK